MQKKLKVLVTGGAGYIGSHTVVELQQKGFDVVIADNLSNSSTDVIENIKQITGIKPDFKKTELCDFSECDLLFEEHPDIKAVIHFAAFKAVGESVLNPVKYYKNNLFSLINLIDVMKKRNVNYLLFSSSCTVYGLPDLLPVNEDSPVKPAMSPYGNTKQISEEILQDEVNSDKNLKVIALRYFNPIGAHESAIIGENSKDEPNNLLPYITQTATGKLPFLRVFGDDYDTPDGTAIRDYIHVSDIAEAHVIAIKRMIENLNNSQYETFNLGTGKGYSVKEVIQTFEKVTERTLPYKITERRAGDIPEVWADTTKANETLGWKAKRNLSEMISSAWEWEKKLSEK